MGIKDRILSKTPPFFRKLRTVGLSLIAVGTTMAASVELLPVELSRVGGYLIVAGSAAVAVCQVVVKDKK
ncbi:hypothetical protein EGT74_08320 [Chitinophaga lutea]|uniref:Uncharacterized protein n=1 Tax=Chitinophaga lutea TaxID=2488634 RepID=A0A3N4Q1Q6_9BACT|nr:hypothetical protein [Chitinophaga lutea]RPE13505.1 hypothetical protein EGT74_08320 [Chitinophaga lutea]